MWLTTKRSGASIYVFKDWKVIPLYPHSRHQFSFSSFYDKKTSDTVSTSSASSFIHPSNLISGSNFTPYLPPPGSILPPLSHPPSSDTLSQLRIKTEKIDEEEQEYTSPSASFPSPHPFLSQTSAGPGNSQLAQLLMSRHPSQTSVLQTPGPSSSMSPFQYGTRISAPPSPWNASSAGASPSPWNSTTPPPPLAASRRRNPSCDSWSGCDGINAAFGSPMSAAFAGGGAVAGIAVAGAAAAADVAAAADAASIPNEISQRPQSVAENAEGDDVEPSSPRTRKASGECAGPTSLMQSLLQQPPDHIERQIKQGVYFRSAFAQNTQNAVSPSQGNKPRYEEINNINHNNNK